MQKDRVLNCVYMYDYRKQPKKKQTFSIYYTWFVYL